MKLWLEPIGDWTQIREDQTHAGPENCSCGSDSHPVPAQQLLCACNCQLKRVETASSSSLQHFGSGSQSSVLVNIFSSEPPWYSRLLIAVSSLAQPITWGHLLGAAAYLPRYLNPLKHSKKSCWLSATSGTFSPSCFHKFSLRWTCFAVETKKVHHAAWIRTDME